MLDVWVLWMQGFNNAPPVVKKCLERLKQLNVDCNIHELDMNNLPQYIDMNDLFLGTNMSNNHRANLIRLILLKKYGGVWIDSTVLCHVSISSWLPTKEGFFCFNRPSNDRLLSNWFIYAAANNYIIDEWYTKTVEYWTGREKAHKYFWMHELFNNMYESDPKVKEIWDKVPKLCAKKCFNLWNYFLRTKYCRVMFGVKINQINDSFDSVHKDDLHLLY